MDWLINLFTNTESVAHIAILYAIVVYSSAKSK